MKIKIVKTSAGYIIQSRSNDRREKGILSAKQHVGNPALVGNSELKAQIIEVMVAGGLAYEKSHKAQGYTGIGKGV